MPLPSVLANRCYWEANIQEGKYMYMEDLLNMERGVPAERPLMPKECYSINSPLSVKVTIMGKPVGYPPR